MTHASEAGPARSSGATQTDIARELGVSRTLVSFALRGTDGVSPTMRASILATADRLGYRHNTSAARLASKRPTAIGLYLLDLYNEAYADVFAGVQAILSDAREDLVLSASASTMAPDTRAIESLIRARVGVIIAATLIDSDAEVQRLSSIVPIVSAARIVDGVDSISSDDVLGGRLATRHLLDLGHRDIVHLAGPANEGHQGRRQGYEVEMAAAGASARVVETLDYGQAAAARATQALLDSAAPPTAIFAHNDQFALGVRDAAFGRGLSIPDDLSLVGYDDSRLARLPGIDLTTVALDAVAIGRGAADLARRRLLIPNALVEHRRLDPQFTLRKTTAARL